MKRPLGWFVAWVVSLCALQCYGAEGTRGPRDETPHPRFDPWDGNLDGILDDGERTRGKKKLNEREEWQAERRKEARRKVLEKFDANHDGTLDESEKTAAKKAFEEHKEREAERRKEAKHKTLDKFDANQDGKLDDAERKAAKEAMKEHAKSKHKPKPSSHDEASKTEHSAPRPHK